MTSSIVVTESPCEAEGGCPLEAECKANRLDCYSFRQYSSCQPRIGIDKTAAGNSESYRPIQDRGIKRRRLIECRKEYPNPWRERWNKNTKFDK